MNDLLSRSYMLLGEDMMQCLSNVRIIVFGVGGVGSWCVESLVRTGVKHITIVDGDRVCASNVNRQLMATTETIGEIKVEALKKRLLSISPDAEITALHELFTEESADSFGIENYNYVIDCIDSLADKAYLIRYVTAKGIKLFSSMGAALKMNPTRVQVAEFWKVKGCPLARALRQRFKREGKYPAHKFQCVYSDELLKNRIEENTPDGIRGANGSLMHITAIFGLTLCGLLLKDIQTKCLTSIK